jgi:hypothetical protein
MHFCGRWRQPSTELNGQLMTTIDEWGHNDLRDLSASEGALGWAASVHLDATSGLAKHFVQRLQSE